ncbi:MAG: cyclase family protein [Candidatus Hodarchaeales archaeon]|jgi:kynurenine formamidase
MFVDLSHSIWDYMPGYKFKKPDGTIEPFTLQVGEVIERELTKSLYENDVEFLLSKVTMHTAIGTYLDTPFHRYKDGKDHNDYTLERFIMEGVVINLEHPKSDSDIVDELMSKNVRDKAVLFHFGMSKYWGTEKYFTFEAISEEVVEKLIELKIKIAGVDTINIDAFSNKHRPAHTKLLAEDILIIENLKNLDQLINRDFRLFAVPLSIKGVANFPIRAFAEINT